MKKLPLLFALFPVFLSAQWSSLPLSEAKFYTQSAAAMGKALFIGGAKAGFSPSKKIEIYDFATSQLTTRNMQFGRVLPGVVVADSLVFIAGGINPQTGAAFSQVEIYDVKNDVWKPVEYLSIARASTAAVKVGDELWFAGGYIQTSPTAITYYDVIDVYHLQTSSWSTRQLSVSRICSGASLGNKVVFAGGGHATGVTATVDIFDTTIEQWDTAQLSVARFNTAITTAGPYVIIAGGSTTTEDAMDVVDLWNTETGEWTTATLSEPRSHLGAATVCGTIAIFAGGGEADWDTKMRTTSSDRVDIFDASTNQWTQDSLATARSAAFAAADGEHFFLGGGWHPEASQLLSNAELYTCNPSSGINPISNVAALQLSPNPVENHMQIAFDGNYPCQLLIYNQIGRLVKTTTLNDSGEKVYVPELLPGLYMLHLIDQEGRRAATLLVKQ